MFELMYLIALPSLFLLLLCGLYGLTTWVFHAKRKSPDEASEPSKSKRKGCSTDRSDQPFRIRELKELVLSHCTPFY